MSRRGSIALARTTATLATESLDEHCLLPRNNCHPSEDRLSQANHESPLDLQLLPNLSPSQAEKTVFYLAYGSNLCAATFRERRGIKPLSQINVLVPGLTLTFDLPGIPYIEPCFANTRMRKVPAPYEKAEYGGQDYHKDRWHKPLVGVVYEVTLKDYATIIATEGGGSSYKDIVVDCHPITTGVNEPVQMYPDSPPFKAHTLYAQPDASGTRTGGRIRPDPNYAQPSPRYKGLLTVGAEECELPLEYRSYLDQIRPYVRTTTAQQAGMIVLLMIWSPVIGLTLLMQRLFRGEGGVSPPWLMKLADGMFTGVWVTYDRFFNPIFGDGERTIQEDADRSLRNLNGQPKRDYWVMKANFEIFGWKGSFSL